MKENYLSDALFNLSPQSSSSADYAKGLLVGVVATLASQSKAKNPYLAAVKIVKKHLPKDVRKECFPENWLEDFNDAERVL